MEHKHDGSLCDLLFFFLSNLFRTQAEEEENSNAIQADSNDAGIMQKTYCNFVLKLGLFF